MTVKPWNHLSLTYVRYDNFWVISDSHIGQQFLVVYVVQDVTLRFRVLQQRVVIRHKHVDNLILKTISNTAALMLSSPSLSKCQMRSLENSAALLFKVA